MKTEKIANAVLFVNGDVLVLTYSKHLGVVNRKNIITHFSKMRFNITPATSHLSCTYRYSGKSISSVVLSDGFGNLKMIGPDQKNAVSRFETKSKELLSGVRKFTIANVVDDIGCSRNFTAVIPQEKILLPLVFGTNMSAFTTGIVFTYLKHLFEHHAKSAKPKENLAGFFNLQALKKEVSDGWKNFVFSAIDFFKPDVNQYKTTNSFASDEQLKIILEKLSGEAFNDEIFNCSKMAFTKVVPQMIAKYNKELKIKLEIPNINDMSTLPGNFIFTKIFSVKAMFELLEFLDKPLTTSFLLTSNKVSAFQYAIDCRDYITAGSILHDITQHV